VPRYAIRWARSQLRATRQGQHTSQPPDCPSQTQLLPTAATDHALPVAWLSPIPSPVPVPVRVTGRCSHSMHLSHITRWSRAHIQVPAGSEVLILNVLEMDDGCQRALVGASGSAHAPRNASPLAQAHNPTTRRKIRICPATTLRTQSNIASPTLTLCVYVCDAASGCPTPRSLSCRAPRLGHINECSW
jgi:hypothetical protein